MLRRFSINFAIYSMIMDAFLAVIGLEVAVLLRPALNEIPLMQLIPEPVNLPLALYIIFPLLWVGILSAFAIYDGRKYLRVVDEYAMLTLASLIASISMAGILYLSYRQVSRALFLSFVLIVFLLFLSWRGLARLGFRLRKEWPDAARRVLIVGAGPLGVRIGTQIGEAGIENMECRGYVDDEIALDEAHPDILGKFCDIRELVNSGAITDVVIALPHSLYQRMNEVVNTTTDLPVKVWVALGFFDLAMFKTEIENFAGVPMVDLRAPALSDFQRLAKRGFDLILGALACAAATPIMVLIGLIVRIFDGRPVFYLQKRVGENGRVFKMYKFRTMVKNADQMKEIAEKKDAEGNIIHKSENDPRVTQSAGGSCGGSAWTNCRSCSTWSREAMSLVGPRPELPYLVAKYQNWQRKRFAVAPGMTGWWQVNGRSERMMHLHTEDDLYYINNYSIWLDIQILVRTLWVVLIGKGSY